MGDVKYPTWVTLIGYWVIALPLAYYLAFPLKMEVVGIWYALLISLVFVGIALFLRYRHLIRKVDVVTKVETETEIESEVGSCQYADDNKR